ncbi:hypothetical protein P4L24_25030 [Bacillus cereus]|nr:hypothetical protein [Bacillus cereus]
MKHIKIFVLGIIVSGIGMTIAFLIATVFSWIMYLVIPLGAYVAGLFVYAAIEQKKLERKKQ